MTRVTSEHRRRIPLTSFTLLTVPEEPMLSGYLKRVEAIDVSMMERSLRAEGKAWPGGSSGYQAKDSLPSPPSSQPTFDESITDGKSDNVQLEHELDKFMGALTAAQAPDAVIKTIARSKSSKLHPSKPVA
ncbi:hypothetical protein LTS15_003784 [Exophiala xenobiotica]|nr:hypothetical protein LTS15_003784 [Exophiala xenobiotica]